MDGEEVIEQVQESAAVEVAQAAQAAVIDGAAVVLGAVQEVGDEVIDAAQVSEERHEEILEGQEWLENQFQQLTATQATFQATLATILQSMATQAAALEYLTERERERQTVILTPLPDSTLSNPPIAQVEPNAAGDDPANQRPPSQQPNQRPRVRRI